MISWDYVTMRIATGGGVGSADDVAALVAGGITHILDVTSDEDDTQWLQGYPGLGCCYNPTADDGQHPKPVNWFLQSLVFALPALTVPGVKVYAHCSAGMNRGPSTALAIMLALGWDFDTGLALVKAKRPGATVIYAPDALEATKALKYA